MESIAVIIMLGAIALVCIWMQIDWYRTPKEKREAMLKSAREHTGWKDE